MAPLTLLLGMYLGLLASPGVILSSPAPSSLPSGPDTLMSGAATAPSSSDGNAVSSPSSSSASSSLAEGPVPAQPPIPPSHPGGTPPPPGTTSSAASPVFVSEDSGPSVSPDFRGAGTTGGSGSGGENGGSVVPFFEVGSQNYGPAYNTRQGSSGSTGNYMSSPQYSSNPASGTFTLDQIFSTFLLPSSTQQQYQQQQNYPYSQHPAGGQQYSTMTSTAAPAASNEGVDKLSMDLLTLLGKASSTTVSSNSSSSASPSKQQVQPTTVPPPVNGTSGPQSAIASDIASQLLNTPPKHEQLGSGDILSSLMNVGTNTMPQNFQQSMLPLLSTFPMGANILYPLANMQHAKQQARASRDLGCKTLSELLDVEVPRPLDLNCHRLCPVVMPGAITGKRFGLTCLCCPVYVSDQAIGMRTMYRRAEALT